MSGEGITPDSAPEENLALNKALVAAAKDKFTTDSRALAETDDPLEKANHKVFQAREALVAAQREAEAITNKRRPLIDTLVELRNFLSRNGERQHTINVERALEAQYKKQP